MASVRCASCGAENHQSNPTCDFCRGSLANSSTGSPSTAPAEGPGTTDKHRYSLADPTARPPMRNLVGAVVAFGIVLAVGVFYLFHENQKADPKAEFDLATKCDAAGYSAELSKGFDPQSWNANDGQLAISPLHIAAGNNCVSIVRIMLDKGVRPDLHLNNGATSIVMAAASGSRDVVSELLKRGVDINSVTGGNAPMTPLVAAIVSHNPQMVQFLLDSGAQVNGPPRGSVQGLAGLTPLQAVVTGEQLDPEILSLLLKHGVTVDPTDIRRARQIHGKEVAMLLATLDPGVQTVVHEYACDDCPFAHDELADLAIQYGKLKPGQQSPALDKRFAELILKTESSGNSSNKK